MLSNAALLDELMGRDRNLAPTDDRPKTRWDDDEVCKHYMVEYCPHDLFTNTRADLGLCGKLHDDELKRQYQESHRRYRMGYEEEFIKFLQGMISDIERRISKGRQRLQLNNHPPVLSNKLPAEDEEKSIVLTDRIEELLAEAEALGCDGQVEESQGIMRLAEQLKKERDELHNAQKDQVMPMMKEMEVCDICGAFLIVGDAKSRAEEHLMGKQHMGYAKIRITVTDMIEAKHKREEERLERLKQERLEREAEREKERGDRRRSAGGSDSGSSRRRRSRSRSRDRRSRRSRSRDRRSSRRSRSRDRRRSRSRDRSSRRSRSKDRRRSRSRDRRSRDRSSRSRDRRSRDRTSRSRRSEDRRSSDRAKDDKKGAENGSSSSDHHHQSGMSASGDAAPAGQAFGFGNSAPQAQAGPAVPPGFLNSGDHWTSV